MRRFYRGWGRAAALLVSTAAAACRPGADSARVTETRRLMGVPWTITLHAASEASGRAGLEAAFAEIARLDRVLSDYDPDSELSALSAAAATTAPVPVGADLWNVLERAVAIRDASGGAFDPTVGPLTGLWRQARRTGRLPRPEKLATALEAVGPQALRLEPGHRAVSLPRTGTRLDLGGIGMGYAVDRALAVLRRRGIRAALVDASGDVAASGPPPGQAGWRVAVRGPQGEPAAGTLLLVDGAVTTSGDAYQAVEIDGVRYSHIVDPRTGLGVPGSAAVTVTAPDCTTADALATAASVLGPRAGADLIGSFPGCGARFVWVSAGVTHETTAGAWPAQLAHPTSSGIRP